MILENLFKSQSELDSRIIQEHKLFGIDEFDKKIVAFIVEMSEMSNEIRFFKFWSHKPSSDRNTILSEYVDSLHFLLSIGNDLSEICGEEIQTHDYNTDILFEGLTEEFISIIRGISTIQLLKQSIDKTGYMKSVSIANCIDWYTETMERLLMLGEKLGFSWEDIQEGYYAKHKLNYQRQDQGY